MEIIEKKIKKYDITIKKLFDNILNLSHEQQIQVLNYVEELIVENKRKSDRKQCNIQIRYATKKLISSDTIMDISQSGLFIKTSDLFIKTRRSINVGEEIKLSFNMDGYDRPFKIKGKVVRSTQEGIGIEFEELNPYIAEMLGALVDRM
jgi:Tfp pilus assembly protein PilZ